MRNERDGAGRTRPQMITDEQIQDILKMKRQGAPTRKVAEKHNISTTSVTTIARAGSLEAYRLIKKARAAAYRARTEKQKEAERSAEGKDRGMSRTYRLKVEANNPEMLPDDDLVKGIELDGFLILGVVDKKPYYESIMGLNVDTIAKFFWIEDSSLGPKLRQAAAIGEGYAKAKKIFEETKAMEMKKAMGMTFARMDRMDGD